MAGSAGLAGSGSGEHEASKPVAAAPAAPMVAARKNLRRVGPVVGSVSRVDGVLVFSVITAPPKVNGRMQLLAKPRRCIAHTNAVINSAGAVSAVRSPPLCYGTGSCVGKAKICLYGAGRRLPISGGCEKVVQIREGCWTRSGRERARKHAFILGSRHLARYRGATRLHRRWSRGLFLGLRDRYLPVCRRSLRC